MSDVNWLQTLIAAGSGSAVALVGLIANDWLKARAAKKDVRRGALSRIVVAITRLEWEAAEAEGLLAQGAVPGPELVAGIVSGLPRLVEAIGEARGLLPHNAVAAAALALREFDGDAEAICEGRFRMLGDGQANPLDLVWGELGIPGAAPLWRTISHGRDRARALAKKRGLELPG